MPGREWPLARLAHPVGPTLGALQLCRPISSSLQVQVERLPWGRRTHPPCKQWGGVGGPCCCCCRLPAAAGWQLPCTLRHCSRRVPKAAPRPLHPPADGGGERRPAGGHRGPPGWQLHIHAALQAAADSDRREQPRLAGAGKWVGGWVGRGCAWLNRGVHVMLSRRSARCRPSLPAGRHPCRRHRARSSPAVRRLPVLGPAALPADQRLGGPHARPASRHR